MKPFTENPAMLGPADARTAALTSARGATAGVPVDAGHDCGQRRRAPDQVDVLEREGARTRPLTRARPGTAALRESSHSVGWRRCCLLSDAPPLLY
jgi:hypothetical protein